MMYLSIFDDLTRNLEERLKRYQREIKINGGTQITGQIANQNLQPLDLTYEALFEGILGLGQGGTGQDLSGTGPGNLRQNTPGADITVGDTPFSEIDFAGFASTLGEVLLSNGDGTASFGPLDFSNASASSGILSAARGGTGVNNGTRTLSIGSNAGAITFTGAGSVFTIPTTGTAALLGLSNQAFTENNSFAKILRAHNTSGTTGYGMRIWDGTNDWGNLQALDLSGNSFLFFSLNRFYTGAAWDSFNSRVGCSFQLTNDGFNFYSFAASSNVAVSRLGVTGAGVTTINLGDAATNAASNLLVLQHNSSGTPAAGFGSTVLTRLASSTTDDQSAASDVVTWATATHASRKARRVWNVFDTAAREALRIESSGTAAMIGFLGAAAVARPTVTGSRGGNAALASLLTQLATLGLITDSSS